MTPAARVQAAIEVLDSWRAGTPAERALLQWSRGARYAGAKDRAAVRDHVYHVLRCKGRAAALGGGESGRAWMIGALRLSNAPVDELFAGAGYGPAPLTPDERSAAQDAPIEIDTPTWLRPKLAARFGADLPTALDAFAARAPVYLRVNLRRANRAEAQRVLSEAGIETIAHPTVATALSISEGARRLSQSKAYTSGLVEVQDLSVQSAVLTCAWPNTGKILDFCAGGGGKALAIADQSDAAIYAHDAAPERMADLTPRAERAGVRIRVLRNADDLRTSDPFDAVLCDVPCSGSGTWRRDPEPKWRLTPAQLATLIQTQAAILRDAARLVGPGGRLIYMTCSLFMEENEEQIQNFLDLHSEWRKVGEAQYSPLCHSDGFYVCTLQHQENA